MQKKRSFAAGAMILAVSGVIVRVIGACYRIPMTNLIGEEGIALYQYAYPIFGLLLALITAGIPPALARSVSECIGRGEQARARRMFRVCLALMASLGFLGAVGLFCAAPAAAQWVGDPLAELPLRAIAPALFPVAVLAAYRGYFQGMQRMLPTALTQITEQAGKLVLGLTMAGLWAKRGAQYAAAGAILGMTLSEVLAVLVMLFWGRKDRISPSGEPARDVLKRLLPTALPLMGGALLMPLVGMADSFVVNRRLLELGYSAGEARALYGLMTGPVNTLINMPSVIPCAISAALVPAVAQADAARSKTELQRKSTLSLRAALTLSVPAAVMLAVMAVPLMDLLYSGLLPERRAHAAELLRITSPAVAALSLAQVSDGLLQGMGRARRAVAALGAGVVMKMITTYTLTGILPLNITGACLGTVVCYITTAFLSLHSTRRLMGGRVLDFKTRIQPLSAGGMMAWAMELTLKRSAELAPIMQILLASAAGIAVYGAALWMVGGITKEEIRSVFRRRMT